MKVSKRQLRRIIKEEKTRLVREQPDRYKEFGNFDRYSGQKADSEGAQYSPRDNPGGNPTGLYVNLTDEQENALNDLEAAMAVCVRAGCSSADVMDTVQGYNLK